MPYKLYILSACLIFLASSCSSPKSVSTTYYYKNERVLNSIEATYKKMYQVKPFALQFTNKTFDQVSIDILTDSIKYVCVFKLDEKNRMNDTLTRYGLNTSGISSLINQMKEIKCTWINNLDYYVDGSRHYMIFMSIRQRSINAPFVPPKYYILTYFPRTQYFDEEGRLLDRRRVKRLRKINGDIFYRINDKVCYTVSNTFR